MDCLAETILSSAKALPEGGLIFPKSFLHLASRAAVDQVLTRLTREGKLMRVSRGAYTAPISSRFGVRPPSTISVVKSMESISGEIVVPNGAAEANALGLTMQVPIREVFLTSGRSRKFHLGKRPAGIAIRALFWLGSEQAPAARATLPSWMARAVSQSKI